jgi:hypothetical protein
VVRPFDWKEPVCVCVCVCVCVWPGVCVCVCVCVWPGVWLGIWTCVNLGSPLFDDRMDGVGDERMDRVPSECLSSGGKKLTSKPVCQEVLNSKKKKEENFCDLGPNHRARPQHKMNRTDQPVRALMGVAHPEPVSDFLALLACNVRLRQGRGWLFGFPGNACPHSPQSLASVCMHACMHPFLTLFMVRTTLS